MKQKERKRARERKRCSASERDTERQRDRDIMHGGRNTRTMGVMPARDTFRATREATKSRLFCAP